MDSVARRRLREMVGGLRRVLEAELGSAADGMAWAAAMRLVFTACARERGIAGAMPDFFFGAAGRVPEAAEAACRDILSGAGGLLAAPAALGWLHQFWYDGERAGISARGRADRYAKIAAGSLMTATQVYSEEYMVDFLLANSLGALWLDMHPESPLAAKWPLFVNGLAGRGRSRPAMDVTEITVCDPACGAGNFLLAAFDMVFDMYREAGESDRAAGAAALGNNLFGLDIDGRAVAVARAALWLRAKERAPGLAASAAAALERNIVAVGGGAAALELGSLLAAGEAGGGAASLLRRRYAVVATNPPYLDKRDYSRTVRAYLRKRYPTGAGNIYGAFILRCLAMADRYTAMVTPQTFLFIRSYARLRQGVFGEAAVRTLAQLGLGAFADAVVDAALFVLERNGAPQGCPGVYFKLLDEPQKAAALRSAVAGHNAGEARPEVFVRTLAGATALPGRPAAYWLGDGLRKVLESSRPLSDYADVVLGMKTSDNRRFVRYWWEVAGREGEALPGWMAYEKEASGYRYGRLPAHSVRWTAAAREYYRSYYSAQLPNPRYWRREGIVFGLISSKAFTAKLLPAGYMTDMAASGVYPRDGRDTMVILGLLNAKVYQWLLKVFNPTVNYQPGDLLRLPVPAMAAADREEIGRLAIVATAAGFYLRAGGMVDRGFRLAPAVGRSLRETVRERMRGLWLASLRQVLAADAIDARLAAVLALPPEEAGEVAAGMGAPLSELPALRGYDGLPPELAGDGLPGPGRVVDSSAAGAEDALNRLRGFFEAGPSAGEMAEAWFSRLTAECGLHPITVCRLLIEDGGSLGWRCRPLEKALAEELMSAAVLAALGHAWPEEAASAGPSIVPLTRGTGRPALAELVWERLGRYGDAAGAAAEFAALTGECLEKWLATGFFRRHVAQFRRRPVVWQVSSGDGRGGPAFSCLVHCQRAGDIVTVGGELAARLAAVAGPADKEELRAFLERLGGLDGYAPQPDYGVRLNVAPLQAAGLLAAPVLTAAELARALEDGRDRDIRAYVL